MLVTEDIPAQSAMMLPLAKRMEQREKLHVALHVRALLHEVIRNPGCYADIDSPRVLGSGVSKG